MEARYEIREKIGQGGLGSVYRAFDTRMNRDVAVKRIAADGDSELQSEATEQLSKEAGALASLQHPHIVTIYDVGQDEEGPFVVMELISGKTLDELLDTAPLTWPDFRELALQSQEALIAAHELGLIHRDIKSGNLMLNWLPSGKFQIKIVDFGLARLVAQPSIERVEEGDTIYGSIYFMAPEQFERGPLDARTDLYSMGCVYYHALTGIHPFDGQTAHEVMTSHLHHRVTPLQELRPDLPRWVCDWVMWQMNRQPSDRPETARQSLKIFLVNDSNQGPITAPQPTTPVVRNRPPMIGQAAPQFPAAVAKPKTITQPQPLAPPEGSKPSVHTTPIQLPSAQTTTTIQQGPGTRVMPVAPRQPSQPSAFPARRKAGMNPAKKALLAILAVAALGAGAAVLTRANARGKQAVVLEQLVTQASQPETVELPVTGSQVGVLLNGAAETTDNARLQTIYRALLIATPADGTDIEARIAEFATTRDGIPTTVRDSLIRDLLRQRGKATAVPALLEFVRSSGDPAAATTALETARTLANESQWEHFLGPLLFTTHDDLRRSVEAVLTGIIQRSTNRANFGPRLATAYDGALEPEVRHALIRLLGRAGGDRASRTVLGALESTDREEQAVAATALGVWPDDTVFGPLMNTLKSATDPELRSGLFDSSFRILLNPNRLRDASTDEEYWKLLASNTRSPLEQDQLLRSLTANKNEPWVADILRDLIRNGKNQEIIDRATRALERLEP